MATIRETLKQLAADTLPDYTYLFEDWVYDTVNVALAYLDTVPRAAEGEENGECIDRMKVAGARMIRAINQSHQFEPLEGQQYYETIIERLSTIVSGVMYSLQLTQSIGGCEV